jgi:hypothetical protein
LDAALAHYYHELLPIVRQLGSTTANGPGAFQPVPGLPELSPAVRRFWSVTGIRAYELGSHRGTLLRLLDLRGNPGTATTKTFPSHVIVARAVHHVQQTGEPVLILTPSSANKGTAMRDAVARAIAHKLVAPNDLQVVVLAPESSAYKLWSGPLNADAGLRRRNPIILYDGPGPRSEVKAFAQEAADVLAPELHDRFGVRLWYTLELANYMVADAVRAFFEQDLLPSPLTPRLHVHAVSSAYGLLGHDFGRRLRGRDDVPPAYLLVQHLGTPDMVLSLRQASGAPAGIPAYERQPATDLFAQHSDARFPSLTSRPDEVLEPTFYTHQPATSPAMNDVIARQGGDGIVVSMHECLGRYEQVRGLLADTEIALPADPRRLREWSLVMAVTGALNALDRGLVAPEEIVIHASGSYSAGDYDRVPSDELVVTHDPARLHAAIRDAVTTP